MELYSVFGYLASVSLIITLLPQIHTTYKSKKADDLSYFFLFMNILTCSLFLIYGVLLGELPLILANTAVLSQTFILIILKFIYS